mgnify:CR=1 FL=1
MTHPLARFSKTLAAPDLIARLRADHGAAAVRLVTADHSADLRARAAVAGVDLVTKPIDAPALRAVLAAFGLSAEATTKGV